MFEQHKNSLETTLKAIYRGKPFFFLRPTSATNTFSIYRAQNYHLSFSNTTHGVSDIADPSGAQDACHL